MPKDEKETGKRKEKTSKSPTNCTQKTQLPINQQRRDKNHFENLMRHDDPNQNGKNKKPRKMKF